MLKSFDRGKQEWRLVSAAGVELVLDVEGAELWVHHEQMFLSETQATGVCAGGVYIYIYMNNFFRSQVIYSLQIVS